MIRETSRLVSIRVPAYNPESPALVWMALVLVAGTVARLIVRLITGG